MKPINGTYYCKIDSKGRIMLPSELRKQFIELNMDSFILKRAIYNKNLEMHPIKEWDKLMEKLNGLNRFKKKNVIFLTRFLADARNVNIDSTGRMQVPKDLVLLAGLKKEIVITSEISLLQIWDRTKYDEFIKNVTEDFEDLSEEVMSEIDFNE
jgi:MraZ protein